MIVVTLSRKPIKASTTDCVLRSGCGALNIGATRIGNEKRSYKGSGISQQRYTDGRAGLTDGRGRDNEYNVEGRWPSNLLLNRYIQQGYGFGDNSSRYFKQFKNEVNMQTQIPQEMLDYLLTMITPPPHVEPNIMVIDDLSTMDFEPLGDASVHGVIAFGVPTKEQSNELLRIMKEGAHVMCVSPKDNPGHHTACNLEESGFEVRDAILYLDQPDGFYYVPKPSRREREEGTGTLKTQTGAQAVGRKEGSKGLDNPRAGAGRTANEIANVHPTVKPIDLMLKLIEDLPEHLQGETVVDPFLGSGTTGIAAVKGGYNFIGVEREEQYLAIADARINHHATAQWRGFTVTVESELIKPEPEPEAELSLADMFSTWGGQ